MHFSLVKINPADASPSHGFDDAIFPLYYALKSLGYEAELLLNRVNPASRNIVFGSCISPRRSGRMLPPGSIIFNLEQINRQSKWCNPNYLTHLSDFSVWDYSGRNVEDLKAAGLKDVTHVPLGYVPEMTRLRPDFPPGSDALFFGLITERRQAILDRALKKGVRLLATQEAFGDLRDRLLANTRLVLNLHAHSPARLEVVRLGYVWANRKAVLSERRPDTEVPEYLEEACAYALPEDIPERAAQILARPEQLRQQAERGFQAFKSRPLAATLEKLLGRRTAGVKGVKDGAAPVENPATEKGHLVDAPYLLKPALEWLVSE